MATYRLIFKNRIVVVVPDIVSETEVDEEVYDLTNYRDDVSNGAANTNVHNHNIYNETGASSVAPSNPPTGDLSDAILLNSVPATKVNYISTSDVASHIPPRNEMKKRTKLKLWSAAGGTGTLLYSAWSDLLQSWGVATSEEYV